MDDGDFEAKRLGGSYPWADSFFRELRAIRAIRIWKNLWRLRWIGEKRLALVHNAGGPELP